MVPMSHMIVPTSHMMITTLFFTLDFYLLFKLKKKKSNSTNTTYDGTYIIFDSTN